MRSTLKKFGWWSVVFGLALVAIIPPNQASAQDQDDPPGRVARLGYLQGSVSFQPAGETDWVGAVPNRPMTTGDQLWTDQDSRAEVQLGSAVIRLAPQTGFSFLNLNDNTVQIQLSSGAINITVRRLNDGDDFEIDTPNQAFTVFQPGRYRVEASSDGTYTLITIRAGNGESTGYGQTYELHSGQVGSFSGTDSLYADVEQISAPDDFDMWCDGRDRRFDNSRSAHYLSYDVVGYDDLDDFGDWRDDSNYGHVWYPNQVAVGWAPYHVGHWDWIAPWGWTWVDDNSWGYAPFHYGRWVNVGGRWGWVAGPPQIRAVYAPALVVFIGGGPGGFGGNVGWFPLGPREVFVPSYHVSLGYVNRVNVSSTTVNITQVTNVYNTTIVNNTTNITNITYANRSIQGAVMVVPQRAFVSAQPVAAASVTVSAREIASASVSARVAVAPTQASVLGARAGTANRVAAPPAAIANRQVVAKKTPPPPAVPFAKQQQALAAHPGQPLARNEVQSLRPANTAAARPMVKQAPPGKAATPTTGRPANLPGNRPGNQPAANAPTPQPNRPAPTQPNNNRPAPSAPANRPETTPNRPAPTPTPAPAQPNNRPALAPPANRPETTPNRQEMNRPPATQPNKPEATRPTPPPPATQPNNHPEPNRNEPAPRQQTPPVTDRPQQRTPPPAEAKPAPPPQKQQQKPQTPEEKKRQQEKDKDKEKPQGE